VDLSDEETTALLGELDRIIEGDRYPFSPRIRTLTAIRDKLRPAAGARAATAAEAICPAACEATAPVRSEPGPPMRRLPPFWHRPNRPRRPVLGSKLRNNKAGEGCVSAKCVGLNVT
jgi:hypothetical protein